MTTLQPNPPTSVGTDVLDHAIWASLIGPHAHLAEGTEYARRYPPDVSPFVGVPPEPGPQTWVDLAELAGPGQVVALSGAGLLEILPPEWEVVMSGEGVQLVATERLVDAPEPEAVRLGEPDVPEMLDLIARTEPGPFLPRTYQLGTYLGFRRDGKLVAMAGERLHPPGWTEISAVCTDPAYRRQGLATRLVRAVAHGIRGRGETPLMHAAAANDNAVRLYLSLGFELRLRTQFFAVRTPSAGDVQAQ